jgi:2'-5' RNA ligase
MAPHSRITWIRADRLHVTLRFIGHVADEQATPILQILRPPLNTAPFDLTVAGVGTFPVTGPPRVVWAGIAGGRDRLVALANIVSQRLEGVGMAREERPFDPHLTLARVRAAGGVRSQALLEGLSNTVLGTTPVDAITLFESRLSPQGPQYEPLQRTLLT